MTTLRRLLATITLLGCMTTSLHANQPPQEFGSKRTWEEIQSARNKNMAVKQTGMRNDRYATPAAEPLPALKYKLYPSDKQLTLGSAAVHFGRAHLLHHQQIHEILREKWREYYIGLEAGTSDLNALGVQLEPYQQVLKELRALAFCRDLRWPLPIRELKGIERFEYLLPEVQQSRELARLLRYSALSYLRQGEFEQAFLEIQAGFRLAELVGTGETLIHQMVGLAIHQFMLDAILDAIKTPQSPNLYWALANMPKSLVTMRAAMEFEIEGVEKALPILAEAENSQRDAEGWKELWSQSLVQIKQFESLGTDTTQLLLFMPLALVAGKEDAKRRLLQCGLEASDLDAMPIERLLALDALYEIRSLGDELRKETLMAELGSPWLPTLEAKHREMFRPSNYNSLGRLVAQSFLPGPQLCGSGSQGIRLAQTRVQMMQARLMTVEAIRMFAAEHGGQVPRTLTELVSAPAIDDPFSKAPFSYQVDEKPGVVTIRLTSAIGEESKALQVLQLPIQGK